MYGNFLILSLLCCIPGAIIYCVRKDLRSVIRLMVPASLPFAFTERFFYPSYWEPQFIWNLADKIGFGIEDIVFVAGFGALTSTVYAFFFGMKLSESADKNRRKTLSTFIGILAVTAILVAFAVIISVPMIYASVFIMIFVSAGMILLRKDLLVPALAGGAITCAIYSLICIVFSLLFRDVFYVVWHGDKFSNIFIAGILLEEYMYSFAAGVAGTVFYPFVSGRKFVDRGIK